MSFSNSSGGTLALPSPTHAHQIDVTSAVRTLRRSISRSPSKFLSRTHSYASLRSDGSDQASPQSPCRRFGSTPQHQQPLPSQIRSAPPAVSTINAAASQQSPFTPFRPNVRLSLRSAKAAKTASPSRPLGRSRISPKSPLKRALNAVADGGNTLPASLALSPGSTGQENNALGARSPIRRQGSFEKRHSVHLDISGSSSKTPLFKSPEPSNDSSMLSSNGLKRSDATMNLDQPSQGSPVAKRRSLHGITGLGQSDDMNPFGPSPGSSPSFNIHEDPASEYELAVAGGVSLRDPLPSPTPTSSVPKRSSSLRKSTLQQRYGERGSLGRRTGERQLAQMSTDFSPVRGRPRLSLDQFVPPPHIPRDSPFSSSTAAPSNAGVVENKCHQPHPLSKTLSNSSSGSSLNDESPVLAPLARAPERTKPHPFSRSLPLNALRPTRPTNEASQSVATPSNSQLWRGAFSSTGLISKVNRNPEEEADRKMAPPDTPCKKHSNPFATFPPPAGSAMKKRGINRNSFGGIPTTPFNSLIGQTPTTFGNPGKGLSIFQRGTGSKNSRRGSVLSLDGDEPKLFGDVPDLVSPLEGDAPPTPTKNTLTPGSNPFGYRSSARKSPRMNREFPPPTSAVRPVISRESTSSPVDGRRTPQTPQESLLPLDTSRLSISQTGENFADSMPPPVTPTTGRDFRSSTSHHLITPVNGRTSNLDVDASLNSRFDQVEQVGKGEFSVVYRVSNFDHRQLAFESLISTTPGTRSPSPSNGRVFAVKKSKHPYHGPRDREVKVREARILQALTHAEHVVRYIDDWEHNFHLYIQTEFCEEGTLDKFLGTVGRNGRLDDFRIFKVLQDVCLGLKEIHDAGFMHLDLKPANILITFEGVLKIGDFGLAQPISRIEGGEVEGDREYMAPETLKGKAGQPADIFALGLIMLETAANVVLPENGPTWVALRSGDLSDVPSLTWNPSSEIQRDAVGNPTEPIHSDDFESGKTHDAGNLFGSFKRSELQEPQEFMINSSNPSSLDSMVQWMTAETPGQRPTVQQILDLEGMRWIAEHRAAPATVYEGNWGPAQIFPVSISVDSDTEMTDV